jgi:hypothetical protein
MNRRRIITHAIVFLLLGAIVNVAVAWGCARWPSFVFRQGSSLESVHQIFLEHFSWATPDRIAAGRHWEAMSIGLRLEIVGVETKPPVMELHEFTDYRAGLPCRAMQGEYLREGTMVSSNALVAVGPDDPTTRVRSALPFRPIWPGFAINTVFYAAVLWMLFAAPFALRRWRRIRRGLCPKCGYDLRGGSGAGAGGGGAGGAGGVQGAGERAVCPECGTPVVNAP